jgi:hypothetical protein
MPSFIFWASCLILSLFLVSSASLFNQCRALSVAFARISSRLSELPQSTGRKSVKADLDAIQVIMSDEPVVRRSWQLFEETLLISPTNEEVYSTQSIEESFPKHTMVEENVHGAFFTAVPGILTGVGLLMTFVAILDGLSHVSVAANMDVTGIGGLINGLSGKFVSSVTAVSCAVAFVFVERFAYSKPNQAYRALIQVLSSHFRRKTTEQLLHEIQTQLAARRN